MKTEIPGHVLLDHPPPLWASIHMQNQQTEIQRLEAVNVKLRSALQTLAVLGERGMEPDYSKWLTFHDKVAQVAREALEACP